MIDIIADYLKDVGELLRLVPGALILERHFTGIGWKVCCEFEYLKPDDGFGGPLDSYRIRCGERVIASWGLYEFPSCCAFCVSTRAFVDPAYRRLGINKRSNEFRQRIAKEFGYSAIICTDVAHNVAERRTLDRTNWEDIYSVLNKRTGNTVILSVKAL